MVFLGMMRFVKYKKIDLFHSDMGLEEALMQNFCSTHNDHVLLEVIIPGLPAPIVGAQSSKNVTYVRIQIVPQDSCLLI